MLTQKAVHDAQERARRARQAMERAFQEAVVQDHEALLGAVPMLPDPGDQHVVAAAMKTRASVIVTDNLKHFPAALLAPIGIDILSADAFIADPITLDTGRAVAAIRRMRERLKRPEKTAEMLFWTSYGYTRHRSRCEGSRGRLGRDDRPTTWPPTIACC